MRIRIVPAMVTLVAAVAVSARQGMPQSANGPRPLYSTAAAFDSARGRLVVFGGSGSGGFSGETWEWDGQGWTRTAVTGPEPRNSPVMVFDSRRNRMVLFGGDTRERIFGDTWAYDGKAWTKLTDKGPPARSIHTMAYDAARDRVVLFGGFTQRRGRDPMAYLPDTWEFDGTAWSRVAETGPAGRILGALAYDPSLRKVVLYGGVAYSDSPGPPPAAAVLGDTWEWDGTRWSQVTTPGPPARDHVSMAYDVAGKRMIMTGGFRPRGAQWDDMWQRVGGTWSRVTAPSTPPLAGHRMVYDTKASRILTFGGFAPNEEATANIWTLNGTTWALIPGPLALDSDL